MSRSPVRTRARILDAALREFSAEGLAGARVDRIARRARVNKRMLYHYFGNKAALFRAVLAWKLAERAEWLRATPENAAEMVTYWFDRVAEDPDWVRLVQWEALLGGPTIGSARRRALFRRAVARLGELRDRGLMAKDLDPGNVLLAMMALTTFPLAFPQVTRLVTGQPPGNRAFRVRHGQVIRRLATALGPEDAP